MMVKSTRKAGERGTRKYLNQYGERLVCVRYVYDPQRKMKYKTVELIVEATPWQPEVEPPPPQHLRRPVTPLVGVQLADDEAELQTRLRTIGGVWDARRRLWLAPQALVERIGLGERVVRL